jgi:hypothetical protein
MDRLMRPAAAKQQQHALAADVEAAKPLVARDRREAEHIAIELLGTIKIIDMETRLDDAVELR